MTPPKKSTAAKKLTPKEARTTKAWQTLERTGVEFTGTAFFVGPDYVGVRSAHGDGAAELLTGAPEGSAILSRAAFEAFIRFYETGSTRKERA